MSYGDVFRGYYHLSRDNMRDHLQHEHEEKMNVIDSMHRENMEKIYNEKNRDNNRHAERMQEINNERNRDNNRHVENIEKIKNE